jgi:hypothetical protein
MGQRERQWLYDCSFVTYDTQIACYAHVCCGTEGNI